MICKTSQVTFNFIYLICCLCVIGTFVYGACVAFCNDTCNLCHQTCCLLRNPFGEPWFRWQSLHTQSYIVLFVRYLDGFGFETPLTAELSTKVIQESHLLCSCGKYFTILIVSNSLNTLSLYSYCFFEQYNNSEMLYIHSSMVTIMIMRKCCYTVP